MSEEAIEEIGKVQSGVSTLQDLLDILNRIPDKTLPVKFCRAHFGNGPLGEWRAITVGNTANLTYTRNNPVEDIAVRFEEWLPKGVSTGYEY